MAGGGACRPDASVLRGPSARHATATRNRGRVSVIEAYMEEHERTVVSATDARQAVRGNGVRYVLAISVTLAVVAMVIAYLVA